MDTPRRTQAGSVKAGPSGMIPPGSVSGLVKQMNQSTLQDNLLSITDDNEDFQIVEPNVGQQRDGIGLEAHLTKQGKKKRRRQSDILTIPCPGEASTRRRRVADGAYLIPEELKVVTGHGLLGNFVAGYLLSLPTGTQLEDIESVSESLDGTALLTNLRTTSGPSKRNAPPVPATVKKPKDNTCVLTEGRTIILTSRWGQGTKNIFVHAAWLTKFQAYQTDAPRLIKGVLKATNQYEAIQALWNIKSAKFEE